MFIYAAIATFGFLLLLLMLVAGDVFGGDHDAGLDHGGFDHGDAGGPSIFSVRVMSAFLAAFGVGGVIARYYGLSHPAASGVGVVSGAAMSGLVFQFAKMLYGQQASSEVHMTSLVGKSAEVSVAIPDGGVGQIMITVGGERSEHIARSADGRGVPRGAEVLITGLRGDSVIVARAAGAGGGAR